MKHLTITVDALTLFDGDVDEIVFTDSDAGVGVQGRIKRAAAGGGLLDLLAAAAKPKPTQPQEDS